MYVIRILGVKGGVGKTTISLYLLNYLSEFGKCLLIDYDNLAYGSLLLGHTRSGLAEEIINGLRPLSESLKTVSDNEYLLKIFSDISTKSRVSKIEAKIIQSIIKRLLKSDKWGYVIIDTPPALSNEDPIILVDGEINYDVFVTDVTNVVSTINFFALFKDDMRKNVLFLNLIPPIKDDIEKIKGIAKNYHDIFDMVVIETFEEQLYLYKLSKLSLFKSKTLDRFIEALLNGEKIIVYPD